MFECSTFRVCVPEYPPLGRPSSYNKVGPCQKLLSVHFSINYLCQKKTIINILPQILGSLPEVIRSCCHHHHQRSSRGRFEWSARFHRPSRRVAGPGKRHSARGTPRAQPRDVRSAGRDTWNLTGEALGGPRKRSWRRCSRARSGRRSAIRGAHSGALDRPEPSDPAARAPIRTSAPYSAADASGSSCAAGARLR